MDSASSHHADIQAAIAKAREDPHTDWVMNLYEWTSGILLVLCLLPAIWLAWKSDNFRTLWRSIRWGWAGFFVCYFALGFIAPTIVTEWTGQSTLGGAFPSRSVLPMALFGWFPGAILSFPVCGLGILWRFLWHRSR